MHRTLALLLGTLCAINCAHAWEVEPGDRSPYYWFTGGFGQTSQEWSKAGIGTGLNITLQTGPHVFAVRWLRNNEADAGFVNVDGEEFDLRRTPDEDINELALLYGRGARTPTFIIFGALGPSYVSGVRRGMLLNRRITHTYYSGNVVETYEEHPFDALGLAASFQISAQGLTMFGLAVELFGNLNPERSWAGILLGVQFGRLR
jgi:hypothetical protein